MANSFLDKTGLSYFWQKINSKFLKVTGGGSASMAGSLGGGPYTIEFTEEADDPSNPIFVNVTFTMIQNAKVIYEGPNGLVTTTYDVENARTIQVKRGSFIIINPTVDYPADVSIVRVNNGDAILVPSVEKSNGLDGALLFVQSDAEVQATFNSSGGSIG